MNLCTCYQVEKASVLLSKVAEKSAFIFENIAVKMIILKIRLCEKGIFYKKMQSGIKKCLDSELPENFREKVDIMYTF